MRPLLAQAYVVPIIPPNIRQTDAPVTKPIEWARVLTRSYIVGCDGVELTGHEMMHLEKPESQAKPL